MKKRYLFLVFFSFIISLSILFYHSSKGYNLLLLISEKSSYGNKIINIIDNVVNEFDLSRSINKKTLKNSDFVDLKFSLADMKILNDEIEIFLSSPDSRFNFMRDEYKNWRKAEVSVDNKFEKIKYKFHGTSLSPMRNGGFSLRVKHKKDSNYRESMRTYNLITTKDDPGINTIIINNIANNYGLISQKGRMVILRINGVKIGMYTLVEHHGKEWFERKMKMTNYALIKSNDDWDTKSNEAHLDDTDLFIEDKEVDGPGTFIPVALGALDHLMEAVRENNFSKVKDFLDLKYMAKYMALYTIINNSHPITGDNLKYVYDFTSGKFKPLFRLEDNIILPIENKIENFNKSLFGSYETYSKALTHRLFKILIRNPEFRHLRDKEINNLINQSDYIFDMIEKGYADNRNIVLNSNLSRRRIKYQKEVFQNNLINNLSVAQEYLSYSKIYVTAMQINNKYQLRVINDSFHPLALTSILYESKKSKLYDFRIKSPILDQQMKIIYNKNIFTLDNQNEFKELTFKNLSTNLKVNQKHIYLNHMKPIKYYDSNKSLKTLAINNIKYSLNEDTIIVKKGNYFVYDNLIFPKNSVIKINKGTTLNLNKDISVLVQGELIAKGTETEPIIVKRMSEKPFGSFAVNPSNNGNKVLIRNFKISGGNQAVIMGIDFTGQFSIHNANVFLNKVTVEKSSSDDGINIKNSKVNIKNSYFLNNYGDQIDLDYCDGIILNNYFSYDLIDDSLSFNSNRDGVDISGSYIKFENNKFFNFSDKAISIGESSNAYISKSSFTNNNNAIVVKDGSVGYSVFNKFEKNNQDYHLFIKKQFYSNPKLYLLELLNENKKIISDGEIIIKSLDQINDDFESMN